MSYSYLYMTMIFGTGIEVNPISNNPRVRRSVEISQFTLIGLWRRHFWRQHDQDTAGHCFPPDSVLWLPSILPDEKSSDTPWTGTKPKDKRHNVLIELSSNTDSISCPFYGLKQSFGLLITCYSFVFYIGLCSLELSLPIFLFQVTNC